MFLSQAMLLLLFRLLEPIATSSAHKASGGSLPPFCFRIIQHLSKREPTSDYIHI